MKRVPVIGRVGIKYGIFVAIAYIVYFLIMRALGLADKTGLRYVNYIILTFGLFVATAALHREHPPVYGYIASMFTALAVVLVSSLVFAGFLLIYVGMIDHQFINMVRNDIPVEGNITALIFALLVSSEAIPIGIVLSLAVSAYHQRYSASIEKAKFEAQRQHRHAS